MDGFIRLSILLQYQTGSNQNNFKTMYGIDIRFLFGTITQDPEYAGEGDKFRARFSVVVNKLKNGERKGEFTNVTIWGKAAENIRKFGVSKGWVFGGVGHTDSYTNSEGKTYFNFNPTNFDVINPQRRSESDQNQSNAPVANQSSQAAAPGPINEEDDLPF